MAPKYLLIALSLLVLLPCSIATLTNETKNATGPSDAKLLTKDVIYLTIKQIRHTRDFVHSIPRLRIVKHHQVTKRIQTCVSGLFGCLSDIRVVLYRLRHLKSIRRDAHRLKVLVPRLVGSSTVCHLAERDLGAMILKVLDMKLVESKLMLLDVLYLVSLLELE
ncbi:conserved hypothetical protein [Ricinus communis]|uniref:Uncharacterized protein n=1 Tax=Ricinus communis TaxID=3988 RepID=B9RQZ9_RICCO|nr:conserved hypothetical protein [Ricinus communis]